MKAIILAGGRGTRLRPLTVYTPKPIVPFVNRPFLTFQLEILRRASITDIALSLNYQPDKILHVLGDGSDYGVDLSYITEPNPMGTGGAYKYASRGSKEPTVVFNGDILTDIIVSDLVERHKTTGADATLCVFGVEDPSRYGVVETDQDGRITKFLEKPAEDEMTEGVSPLINAGIYVLEPQILDLIKEDEPASFEYDVFPKILDLGMNFQSYVMKNDYWCDIRKPESYLRAHHDFLAGRVKRFDIGQKAESAEIATSCEIDKRSVLGENCVIKPGAVIKNSVLGAGVVVEEKARIENSVIWRHSRISGSAVIKGAVLAKSCYVGKNAKVMEGSVLGDKTSLTDYTIV